MSKKITLVTSMLLLLALLASCGTTTPNPNSSSNGTPGNQPSNIGETTPGANQTNQQLLPIVSSGNVALSLDVTASGTTQQLAIGQVLAITLESNPSTGYAWLVGQVDPAILTQLGDPTYQEGETDTTPVVGAPGTETYYFQAAATGTTTLTLEYKRGWETNVAPEKTFTITVEVK